MKPTMTARHVLTKLIDEYVFQTVLDVGCGHGEHTAALRKAGKHVTPVDLDNTGVTGMLVRDFIDLQENDDRIQGFDVVWCSHVLEHQLAPHRFLRCLHGALREGGVLALTVPPAKPQIVNGHVSLWNAGLLTYHLALAGFDCSDIRLCHHRYNITALLTKRSVPHSDVPVPFADLADALPPFAAHRFNGQIKRHNWSTKPAGRVQELPVWVYWEGPMPDWVACCLDTARKHITGLRQLDREAFESLHQEKLPPQWGRIAPNHRSDYVRAYLLATHGGLYLDADCIVMSDLRSILKHLPESDFVSYGIRKDRTTRACALVASERGGTIATAWLKRVREQLAKSTRPKWADLGPDALTWALQQHRHARVKSLAWSDVHPIGWKPRQRKAFLVERHDPQHATQLQPDALCYMLTHRSLEHLRRHTKQDLLTGSSFASYLFRKAMGKPMRRVPTRTRGRIVGAAPARWNLVCADLGIPHGALQSFGAFAAVVKKYKPQLVVAWNFVPYADRLKTWCHEHDVPLVHTEIGWFPHYSTYHADPDGFCWDSDIAHRACDSGEVDRTAAAGIREQHRSAPSSLPDWIRPPYVVFAHQLLRDKVNRRGLGLTSWGRMIRHARGMLPDHIKLVVKEHPQSNDGKRLAAITRKLPNTGLLRKQKKVPIGALLPTTAGVISANSTVLYEARLIHDKPVWAYSRSWFDGVPNLFPKLTLDNDTLPHAAWLDDPASMAEHADERDRFLNLLVSRQFDRNKAKSDPDAFLAFLQKHARVPMPDCANTT